MINPIMDGGNKSEEQESFELFFLHGIQSIVGFFLAKTFFRGLNDIKQFANQGLHAVEDDDLPVKNGAP